jgi:tRNA isopentenyl-2-thiomethyl-A-37 hydroxylase MiaE
MKRAFLVFALVFGLIVPTLAHAASWSGWITDEHCGAAGAKADHASCAKKCANGGGKLVFYNTADQKLYGLDNQALAKEHIGHEVVVNGDVDGTSIKVASIEAKAEPKK